MRNLFTVTAVVLALAVPGYAGVKEKKAIRELEAAVKTGLTEIKTACGNAKLGQKVTVDKKFDAAQIYIASNNLNDFVKGMKKVCEDADYKEEVAKVAKIEFTLTDSGDKTGSKSKIYGQITVKGKTMKVALHINNSMSNASTNLVPNVIKELY